MEEQRVIILLNPSVDAVIFAARSPAAGALSFKALNSASFSIISIEGL